MPSRDREGAVLHDFIHGLLGDLMRIVLSGSAHGSRIDLDGSSNLPDGTRVKVTIEAEPTQDHKNKLLDELCGAWASDPSIERIFHEIIEERHRSRHSA